MKPNVYYSTVQRKKTFTVIGLFVLNVAFAGIIALTYIVGEVMK